MFFKKGKIYEKVKLETSKSQQLHENKFPSQVVSKDFGKILIYLIVYISLNSGIAAFKISNKSQGINQSLSNP